MTDITIVTALIWTPDGRATGECPVDESYILEEAIAAAGDEAVDNYREKIDGNGLPFRHRIIIHIDTFPEPSARETRIVNTLPALPADEPVTSQVL